MTFGLLFIPLFSSRTPNNSNYHIFAIFLLNELRPDNRSETDHDPRSETDHDPRRFLEEVYETCRELELTITDIQSILSFLK